MFKLILILVTLLFILTIFEFKAHLHMHMIMIYRCVARYQWCEPRYFTIFSMPTKPVAVEYMYISMK